MFPLHKIVSFSFAVFIYCSLFSFQQTMETLHYYIPWDSAIFIKSVIAIAFPPLFWNIVGRLEYYTHFITKLCLGNRRVGCYLLACAIFALTYQKKNIFQDCIEQLPNVQHLFSDSTQLLIRYFSYGLFAFGSLMVCSSFWKLGIVGTYLGDYFGILFEERITGFPFSWMNDPMYMGTVMNFFSGSLYYFSPAGVVLSVWVYIVYKIVIVWESDFTTKIYAKAAAEKEKENATTRKRKSQ